MFARLAVAPQPNDSFKTKATRLMLLAVAALAGLQSQANAQVAVDLGSAARFAILAGSAITFSLGPVTITGNIGSTNPAVTGIGNVSFVTGADLTGTGAVSTA